MLDIKPSILVGSHVQLEPFEESHRNELFHVSQDAKIWTYTYSALGEHFNKWFDKGLVNALKKQQIPFAVRRLSDKKIIGSTRYYDISRENHRLTVGYTWYAPEVWGTIVNPECKLLLLQNAFENFHVNRIEIVTDVRNSRSRSAIKKLGATEEGILRQHMMLDNGFIRDTVVFSIIKSEWPTVKHNLESRIASLK